MSLPANTAWFTLTLNGRTDFSVFSFSGEEAVSTPYEFTVELLHPSDSENPTSFIGAPALLRVRDRSGQARPVHGLVREMKYLRRGNHLAHYQCVIVPRLWFLGQTRNHRIFQHQSAPEIIRRILEEQNFTADSFAFKCFHDYPEREYCVQYSESDLHFANPICTSFPACARKKAYTTILNIQRTGIVCAFPTCRAVRASPGKPRFAIFPVQDSPPIPPSSPARQFSPEASETGRPCATGTFSPRPPFWNLPPLKQRSTRPRPCRACAPKRTARPAALQLRRQLTFQTCLEAEADVSRFLPGFTFTLFRHERAELNAGWWIVGVAHQGEQPQVLEHEAPDRGMRYASTVTAIPDTVRYVPEIAHPRNRIAGVQTAIVTGPADEEIYPDAYGRVKVQFFWDREGKRDENTSCWIRVSQGWAGTEFGAMALPRVGHEVIVSFLEGDPDRPVITGRVYHGGNLPPYELPEHKTRTVLRSMSSPGGDGPRGFNELRVEDLAGQEEIFLHAERDVNIHVKNDWKKHILRDRHQTTDRHTRTEVGAETHSILKDQRKTELFADDHLTVHGDSHARVEQRWLLRSGAEIHIEAGRRMVLEAGSELTIKAGGSWLKLDAGGIRIQGTKIDIAGGGKAGEGASAAPLLPEKPRLPGAETFQPPPTPPLSTDTTEFQPPSRQCLCEAAKNKTPCVIFPEPL